VKDGDNRLGPNLHGIVGRKAGSLPDYNYSPSMKDAGFVWDRDKLAHFLARPEEVVSGNKMQPYGGISKEEATGVIAYLQSAAQQR
jgi:cytochrome c